MSLAIISNLDKHFGAELIFSGVSFRIEHGDRLGLVGPNGAGKSTLLNILAGRLLPSEGTVAFAQGTRVGYLTQMPEFTPENSLYEEMLTVFAEVQAMESAMHDLAMRMSDPDALTDPDAYQALVDRYALLQERFEHAEGYTIESRARQILDGLGFSREQQAMPVRALSGGQQTRAALGKLLLQSPDVLLLDEPTNHLDLAALEWLEEYLLAWKGALVIVAHDRYFLDRVTQRIIEVDNHRAEEYPGNYTNFIQLREERRELQRKQYEAQQEQINRTEDFIRRYKAGQRAREARGRQKQLDRLERVDRPYHAPELHFRMRVAYESSEYALETNKLIVGYPNRPLITVPDLTVERGSRIGLLGPNGAGKTTLLRTIVGELAPLAGNLKQGTNLRIGYYAQTHEGLNSQRSVIDEIREVSLLSEEGARTYLGRFQFRGDDVFKSIGVLSGGEKARVALAKLTMQGANFLVLDEPTNHLDLPARQFLEAVLADYDGTLIFVSHDRYFIDAVATDLWIVEGETMRAVEGNYTTYRHRIMQQAARAQAAAKASARAAQTQGRSGKPVALTARTVDRIETEVTAAEQRLAIIEAELTTASEAADVTRITQLAEQHAVAKAELDALYEEWETVASS